MLAAEHLALDLPILPFGEVWKIYGIPRGGVSAAYLVVSALGAGTGCSPAVLVDNPEAANLIVDDLVDSGATIRRYSAAFPSCVMAVLFSKGMAWWNSNSPEVVIGAYQTDDTWLVFPWEVSEAGHDSSAEDSVVRMMQAIGEDVNREGLLETPKRVVKAWGEWFKGYDMQAEDILKVFEDGAENVDEMVLLTQIPVYSHCEHHITPFIGVAHVAYIPNGKIVGLSKLAKVVDMYSRRLQVQERLTNQIADCLQEHLNPLGVAVVIKAKHFCMATRGVNTPNVDTITSAVRGVFRSKPEVRAEFMSLLPRE